MSSRLTAMSALTNDWHSQPNTFRASANDVAKEKGVSSTAGVVGGGSVHFTANYWRFHEIDFMERSKKGPVAGASFADWPITYADLEPYYTKVDWEMRRLRTRGRQSVRSAAQPRLSAPAAAHQTRRRARRACCEEARMARVPRANGDHSHSHIAAAPRA